MSPLLCLPNEILYTILADLGIDDLANCSRACCKLYVVIRSDVFVQYRMILSLSGMVDVPSRQLALSERLDKLRLYGRLFEMCSFKETTFKNGSMSANSLGVASSCISADGAVVQLTRAVGDTRCVMIEPPSLARGLCPSSRELLMFTGVRTDILAIDPSQNLGILIDDSNDRDILIHFLSINAAQLAPHPAASRPVLNVSSSAEVENAQAHYYIQSVQVHGETVAWIIPDLTQGAHILQSWNWRAGELLWSSDQQEQKFQGEIQYCMLDNNRILVAVRNDTRDILEVYDLTQPYRNTPLCTLDLPAAKAGQAHVVHIQSHIPAHREGAHTPFLRNPASTAAVLHLTLGPDAQGENATVLLLIPFQTLHAQAVKYQSDTSRVPSIDWDQWGPSGTLLLNYPKSSPAPRFASDVYAGSYGSRCSVLIEDGDGQHGCVLIFDVDPWVAKCARRCRHQPDSVAGHDVVPKELLNKVLAPPANINSSPTTLPFAVQCVQHIAFLNGRRPSRIHTTHDGFALAYDDQNSEIGLQTFTV